MLPDESILIKVLGLLICGVGESMYPHFQVFQRHPRPLQVRDLYLRIEVYTRCLLNEKQVIFILQLFVRCSFMFTEKCILSKLNFFVLSLDFELLLLFSCLPMKMYL